MTIEENKLIAEFMGYESYQFRGYTMYVFEDNNHRTEIDLHYHDSWDWLMPVVEKCFEREMFGGHNLIMNLNDALLTVNIEEVYGAVIKFIKWYNEQEQKW